MGESIIMTPLIVLSEIYPAVALIKPPILCPQIIGCLLSSKKPLSSATWSISFPYTSAE